MKARSDLERRREGHYGSRQASARHRRHRGRRSVSPRPLCWSRTTTEHRSDHLTLERTATTSSRRRTGRARSRRRSGASAPRPPRPDDARARRLRGQLSLRGGPHEGRPDRDRHRRRGGAPGCQGARGRRRCVHGGAVQPVQLLAKTATLILERRPRSRLASALPPRPAGTHHRSLDGSRSAPRRVRQVRASCVDTRRRA